MKEEKKDDVKEDIKEDFCPPCLAAVPLAFGAGGAKFSESISNPKTKAWILGGSIVTIVIAAAVIIYFKFIKKCSTCK
jgi:hypothetical protein